MCTCVTCYSVSTARAYTSAGTLSLKAKQCFHIGQHIRVAPISTLRTQTTIPDIFTARSRESYTASRINKKSSVSCCFLRPSDTAVAHTSCRKSTSVKAHLSAGSAAYLYIQTSLLDVTTLSHHRLAITPPPEKTVEVSVVRGGHIPYHAMFLSSWAHDQ